MKISMADLKEFAKKTIQKVDLAIQSIHRFSYYTGVVSLRILRQIPKFIVSSFRNTFKEAYENNKVRTEKYLIAADRKAEQLVKPSKRAKDRLVQICKETGCTLKSQGPLKAVCCFATLSFRSLRANRSILITLCNYSIALVSIVVTAVFISRMNSLNFALMLEKDGKLLGYISNESVYELASKQVHDRIVYQSAGEPYRANPTISLKIVPDGAMISENKLTDRLIQTSGREIINAVGVYVDNIFYGAVKDTAPIQNAVDGLLAPYKTGQPGETVTFSKDIQFREGIYFTQSIIEPEKFVAQMTSQVSGEVSYTVAAGDTMLGIASKNNVGIDSLNALNPEAQQVIFPGQKLIISRSVPFMQVKVIRNVTYNQDVAFGTEQIQDNRYYVGYNFVSSKGQNGTDEINANITYIDGIEMGRNVLSVTRVKEPVPQKVVVGSLQYRGGSVVVSSQVGKYVWPVGGSGGYMSCPYGGYAGHKGMDIAAPTGTYIYAVEAGVVEVSSVMSGGLGRYIIINHGNGMKTAYGHCSKLLAQAGQVVQKGELIALVGNTGRSTGPHLHIEFRVNGSYINPAVYLGTRPY